MVFFFPSCPIGLIPGQNGHINDGNVDVERCRGTAKDVEVSSGTGPKIAHSWRTTAITLGR